MSHSFVNPTPVVRKGRGVLRVLQIVKTSDGAEWAALQAAELVRSGVEVHVVLPSTSGRMAQRWKDSGAVLHTFLLDWSSARPFRWPRIKQEIQALVSRISPDIIHSHFLSSTILLRIALGKNSPIPRIFQVPGPLHLEYTLLREAELHTAGPQDYWIASSKCILGHYKSAGISDEHLFLSYYGTDVDSFQHQPTGFLRRKLRIDNQTLIVGNANYIYPPRRYLGQRTGLKCHEDIIDALASVVRARSDVTGVLIGSTFSGSKAYEERLRARAAAAGQGRILMPGYMSSTEVRQAWADFNLAVHVPSSENCGGVLEPMLSGVPVIAGDIGGLPEIVIDKVSGQIVPIHQPEVLSQAILETLASPAQARTIAETGRLLAREMFSVERTAHEVFEIYEHLLGRCHTMPKPYTPQAAHFLHQE